MAITVKNLYKIGNAEYHMRLLSGRGGLNNLVQWIHIVEDQSVCNFLHGQEVVLTTGIANGGKNNYWLLDFAKSLHSVGISAFVLNLGPYIPSVPNEVIAYCESVDLPLFVVPWTVHLVDMTRDLCHNIMKSEETKLSLATHIKNLLFNTGDTSSQLLQLERSGFSRDNQYCLLCLSLEDATDPQHAELMVKLEMYAERTVHTIGDLYISFNYNDYLILVLSHFTDDQIHLFVQNFYALTQRETALSLLHIGISTNAPHLMNLRKLFDEALSASLMSYKRSKPILFYDDLDIYKLLLAISDKELLQNYYNEIVGKLLAYDTESHTELVPFLKAYIENNGSPQAVSEKLFVHRNTVTNTLKKIEKITGYNMLELDAKLKCALSFYIADML